MKLLMIDNYDSFTWNLVHLFEELGADVVVLRNDAITVEEAEALAPDRLVVSPGPGRPADAGVSVELIRRLGPRVPTLGVCLGHQAIVEAFGGEVGQAKALLHGKASRVRHDGEGVFAGLPEEIEAGRYHSLAAVERAGRARRDRAHGRRRGHGRQAPRAPDRGRAVPSRVGAHARRAGDGGELPPVIQEAIGDAARRRDLTRSEARDGDGRDHARRGDAGADRRVPRRAARKGRDRGRDRRLCGGDARARPPRAPDARRRRRHRRHGRRRGAHVQHLDRRGDRRGGGGRGGREARQPRRDLGVRLGRRARGARVHARAAARADRRVDRRARLRLHVRAGAPPGDAARGARAARARRRARSSTCSGR